MKTKQEKVNYFNDLIKEMKRNGEAWRIDEETKPVFLWLYVNNYTELNDMRDLCDMFDNTTPNTELITIDNLKEFDVQTLKELTNHTSKYLTNKLNGSNGYICHYPRTKNGRCFIEAPRKAIYYDLNDLKPKKKYIKKFVVFGGLWFDSVNGNTYHASKILDTETNNIYYTRYQYGYGSQYLTSAKEFIIDTLKYNKEFELLNMGYGYYKKQQLKKGLF